METHLARLIINDIVLTGEYSLSGIAHYTYKPEDVIYEVAIGNNTDPSASLLRKVMELHYAVRPELYQEMMRKVIANHLKMHCKE